MTPTATPSHTPQRHTPHRRATLATWLARPSLAKVPEITVAFWVVKLLTTGMGEAFSDYLGQVSIPLAAGVGLVGLAAGLWLQLRTDRYRPWTYWFTVAMVAVFGTMAADGVHVVLGIPYPVTTALYALALVVVLAVWHRLEHTLSIHHVDTGRRELCYWATVLVTFALGTAAGDLSAFVLRLGYFESALLFAALMVVVFVAWRLGLGEVAAFWTAYVLTRPLGASIADWLGKPHEKAGGLGLGDGLVTLVATGLIVVLVAWLAHSRHGVQPVAAPARQR